MALRYEPTRNRSASPFLYEIDPADLLRLTLATDDADEVFWAIVHSHTHTEARPSATDIRLAYYPDALYILVSLADAEADEVTGDRSIRAWRILDGEPAEVALAIS
jgi:proteasome lid subunit RPN8/RPN11